MVGICSTRPLAGLHDRARLSACRKFHADAITGRLVCTHRGPGLRRQPNTQRLV
ncbi:MAG: DUF1826 domain-containing protein [Tateyamaria sp.]